MNQIARFVKSFFLILIIMGPLFGSISNMIAQDSVGEIRGVVTDELNQSIIGASIHTIQRK